MIIIIITHCTSITSSSTTTIGTITTVLIEGALAVMVTVVMAALIEDCAVIGVGYVAVVVMVTAVLVSLSVEAVFNVPVILIVVGATVRENEMLDTEDEDLHDLVS